MKEIWKTLPFDDRYEVSNLGRVKSFVRDRENGKLLTQSDNGCGYMQCSISGKCFLCHRIVAFTFIPNPDNKKEINHISGDKLDNRVLNLEWNSRMENMKHAIKNGLTPSIENGRIACRKNGLAPNLKISVKDVKEIKRLRNKGLTQQALADKFNVSQGLISNILKKYS